MNRFALALGLSFVLVGGSANAQEKPAKSAPASKFLQPGEVDALLLLAPPPADGSAAAAAEIAELHSIAQSRTPERLARAQHDAEVEDVTAIADVFGPVLNLERYPKTATLFADLRNEDSVAAKAAKKIFKRSRPWEADPSLNTGSHLEGCDKGEPKTSYPSGHATMGWSAGEMLANLMPGNAQIILARADDYAESRLVCGVHYRRDIEASHALAAALVAKLMTKPEFAREVEEARAELTAAHIAP